MEVSAALKYRCVPPSIKCVIKLWRRQIFLERDRSEPQIIFVFILVVCIILVDKPDKMEFDFLC